MMGEEGTTHVKGRRHTPEQVIRKLREADRMVDEGNSIPEVARALEVSENTYHRWQRQFGGMKADPSLPTSGETLTIRDLLTLRARTGACWDVAGRRTRRGGRRGRDC